MHNTQNELFVKTLIFKPVKFSIFFRKFRIFINLNVLMYRKILYL